MAAHSPLMKAPTAEDAIRIVERLCGRAVTAVNRFPTGMAHYVYEAAFADGSPPVVVRLARAGEGDAFQGAVDWYPLLRARAVPLPALLYAELDANVHGFPVMLLERLPGQDLGQVYTSLTSAQRRTLAREVAAFQRRVQAMPAGPGFGYARSFTDPALQPRWLDVVYAHLERSRGRITDPALVSEALVERVRDKVASRTRYFESVLPRPFLDDTTTKNVIVDGGRLTGIVDVDCICFGDIVQLLGLIKMAVLSLAGDTDYVGFLADELSISDEQREMLDLYALLYGLDFLTAMGHRFNKDDIVTLENEQIERLQHIVDELLRAV